MTTDRPLALIPPTANLAERANTLHSHALAAANQHIATTLPQLHELAHSLDAVVKAPALYPVGVVETARRLRGTLVADARTVQALMERAGR